MIILIIWKIDNMTQQDIETKDQVDLDLFNEKQNENNKY